jgi:hypothetical protein
VNGSRDRLVRELRILAGDDDRAAELVRLAERGVYDDIHTTLAAPKMALVEHLRELGALGEPLAQRAIEGEFDSTRAEWREALAG